MEKPVSKDISVMSGREGGISAALAGPENVPDARDYLHADSVGQQIVKGQKDSCERLLGVSQTRVGGVLFH